MRQVTAAELQADPIGVLSRAETDGTLTLVDETGQARLLISVFGEDSPAPPRTVKTHFRGVYVGKLLETEEDVLEHSYPHLFRK